MRKNVKHSMSILSLTVLMCCFFSFSPLHAHTTLVDSTPERASKINDISFIELTFTSELVQDEKAKIYLATIREGKDIPIGETTFVSKFTIKAEVPQLPDPGQYVIRYMVTSLDGDLNDGGYAFELLASKGNNATWLLLGLGVVILIGLALLLRPKKSDNEQKEENE
mgnify:FL=1